MARDPLTLARERLLADGVTEDELATVEADIEALMERAIEAARQAPFPDPDERPATEYGP
jgi:acetoin:2,6-dichlorophenolindophenol oxidoreductase subunit alpha